MGQFNVGHCSRYGLSFVSVFLFVRMDPNSTIIKYVVAFNLLNERKEKKNFRFKFVLTIYWLHAYFSLSSKLHGKYEVDHK